MRYRTHPKGGWGQWCQFGEMSGTFGKNTPLEAIEIDDTGIPDLGIKTAVYMSKSGWLPEISSGQIGIAGENIEAVRFWLHGSNSPKYDLFYQVHLQDYGWLNWAKNGEQTGSNGQNKHIEAIVLKLVEKGSNEIVQVDNIESFLQLTTPPVVQAPFPTVTEDVLRAGYVNIALSHVGETKNYGEYFGEPGSEWCAYFDIKCADEAGIGSIIPRTAWVPDAVSWFINHPSAYCYGRGSYIPRGGDLIYFDYNLNGTPDHTGIVVGCDGSTVTTVEGNTGDPRMVRKKQYPINSEYIHAYGVPNYKELCH